MFRTVSVKGRVINKYFIKEFATNSVFSIDVMDNTGAIRIACFWTECEIGAFFG